MNELVLHHDYLVSEVGSTSNQLKRFRVEQITETSYHISIIKNETGPHDNFYSQKTIFEQMFVIIEDLGIVS